MESVEGKHGKRTVKAGPVNDLPVGETKVIEDGGREILLIRRKSGVYALGNSCIHGSCRLSYGKFEGDTLRCRCHGSVFDIRTGAVLDGPATEPQPTFKVIIENGEITLVP